MARTDGSDPTLTDRADSLESCLTNSAFDRQMLPPCTATAESACQLVDHLSMLNEVLFWAEIELRETPETCGELPLASFANKNTNIQNDAGKTSRAICLFLWLLKAHACIYYVKIHYGVLVAYGRIICDALNCSHSVRAIIIDIGASVVNKHVDDALCSMKRLDLLVCLAVSSCDELWFSLPKVIRIHSSLTTLNISELRLGGSRAQDLVAALKENSTLKELSIHGSVVCDAGRGVFTNYLKTNTSLITLSVGEDDVSNRNCFNWIVEGLLVNEVIKNLSLTNILFDRVNATLAARIFSENKTIRSFHVAYFPQALSLQPDTDYHLWHTPLSNNDTLEELGLPFTIWKPEHWADFSWIAAAKANLKRITVFVHGTTHRKLPTLCKVLKESGAEEKVSLGTYFVRHDVDLMYSKAFSDVDMFCFDDRLGQLVCLLQPFTHITSIRFIIGIGNLPLASSVASYIQATTSLQKLRLTSYGDESDTEENTDTSWAEIAGALSLNRSISELGVYMDIDYADSGEESNVIAVLSQEQIKRLAEAIRYSSIIRRINFGAGHSVAIATFLRSFSERVTDNYILVGINVCGTLSTESAQNCFKVLDTVRRNCGLVGRAAQFIRGLALGRHSAGALEQVRRHAGLLDELAEQQSLSVAEVTPIVRRGLRSIERLHDFMRLAGVVQDSVVCEPRQDSRPQLDTLNEDCWRLVQRCLVLDDVVQPSKHRECQ